MAAKNRVRPLASFPFDRDLLVGLARLAKAEQTHQAVIIRRALRRELEERGVIKPATFRAVKGGQR